MALITISGFPCAGKSTRAQQIQLYLQQRIQNGHEGPVQKVVVLSDHSLGLSRDAYNGNPKFIS